MGMALDVRKGEDVDKKSVNASNAICTMYNMLLMLEVIVVGIVIIIPVMVST